MYFENKWLIKKLITYAAFFPLKHFNLWHLLWNAMVCLSLLYVKRNESLFVFLFTSFQVPPVKVNLSSVRWFKSFTEALTFPDDCLGLTQTTDDEAWKSKAIFSPVQSAVHGTYTETETEDTKWSNIQNGTMVLDRNITVIRGYQI